MTVAIIPKRIEDLRVKPNMLDYRQTCESFSWDAVRRELTGEPGGGLNIAYQAIDRHAVGPRSEQLALRWLGKNGKTRDFTYGDLRAETNRFANVLAQMGVRKGERVFVLAGRIPELYIAALGTLKNGSVFCPLFSAFGPEPIHERLGLGDARVLVTTEKLYQKKVARLRPRLPELKHVLVTDADTHSNEFWSMPKRMAEASPQFTISPTQAEDMALLHFTSGTTGPPKGAIHVHEAVLMHYMTGKYVLDFHPGDVFWCTADPGWVTGTSYGIIAPLVHGITSIIDEADFEAERWYRILENQQVTVWYTAPTAIRMLMRAGIDPRGWFDLRNLRFVASVGEPLNAEAVVWGQEALGLPIHDNWWQTETGGIMIANFPAMEVRPGSMGKPLPGVVAAVVHRIDERGLQLVEEPGAEGELALLPGWPSMFRGYLNDEERYRKCFREGSGANASPTPSASAIARSPNEGRSHQAWYLTGDLVCRDADGYFWFLGRADDAIKTAGHMVGPFEVESILMAHPAVSEAGVIGKPDPVVGEVVKAFVTLKPGFEGSDQLRLELLGFARERLGSAVAPKEIEFKDGLPHTRSAKIMRRLLRARELGLPEGDLSTLEASE